jgi:proteasome lid subunit RPN8/RPN11
MIPCENRCDPKVRHRTFSIDALELLAAEDDALAGGEALLGVVHSHCDGPARPSTLDSEAASRWPDILWLILSIDDEGNDGVAAWWPTSEGLIEVPLSVPPTPAVLLSANS